MTQSHNDGRNNPPTAFNGFNRSDYVVFCGGTEEEPGYGVKTRTGDQVVYAANFYKDTATRITQLLAVNPHRDWDDVEQILKCDGYDIRFVTLDTPSKEVSPSRRYLNQAPTPAQSSDSMLLGAFKVEATLDEDGQLTVIVKSTDGSPAVEVDTEVGCRDDELGYRFTSRKIERDYQSQQ